VTLGLVLITRLLPETEKLFDIGLRIGIAVGLGFLIQRLLFLLVWRSEVWIERVGHHSELAKKRARTIGQIFRSLFTVMVVGTVFLYALSVLGWDVRPLLATAGIAGVALGFGAQTLVRDVIAGIFIIAEDQFGVGDLIEVNGKAATVEALTVRCATLRDFNGFLHFVPNGEMKIVVNRSRGWNRLAVDVPIAHDEDVDRALEVCRGVATAMSAEPTWREKLLDDIQVWGVDVLSSQEMLVRLVVRAEPGPDVHDAARELRRRLQRTLIESDVRLTSQREIAIAASPDLAPSRGSSPAPGARAS
jgi:small-conductance mechanosensitive channel